MEKLCISRRDGVRLVEAIFKNGLIKGKKADNTFLLEKAGEVSHKKEKDFSVLFSSKDEFSPCCNCKMDCDPKTCNMLIKWLA